MKRQTTIIVVWLMIVAFSGCTTGGGEDIRHSDPTPATTAKIVPHDAPNQGIKYNYNVYIENSGSMDGYVKGTTKFKEFTYDLISDIKLNISQDLNLYYINSQPKIYYQSATQEQITDFIQKLDPTNFTVRGGNRTESDIDSVVKMVFRNVNGNNVNIIVSDFIFSPGKGKNALDYLNNQQIGFKTLFAEKMKAINISTVMLRCQSAFQGYYYDKENNKTDFSTNPIQRPYYIMIVGPENAVTQLLENTNFEKYKVRGYEQMCYFHKHDQNPPNSLPAKVTLKYRSGTFEPVYPVTRLSITNAEMADNEREKGLFQFSIYVDFSKIVEDKNYFTNPANYELPENYSISVIPITDTTEADSRGYTHVLKLSTTNLKNQSVFIRLKDNIPDWVKASSSDDDANIRDPQQQNKTFGLNYLIEGINEPYQNSNPKYLFNANVQVEKSSSGGNEWLIWLLCILIFGAIIFFIVKKIKTA